MHEVTVTEIGVDVDDETWQVLCRCGGFAAFAPDRQRADEAGERHVAFHAVAGAR